MFLTYKKLCKLINTIPKYLDKTYFAKSKILPAEIKKSEL